MIVLQILAGIIMFIGIPAGIIVDIKYNGLGHRLGDWPWEHKRGTLPRDTHARARQDGAFVDGMITGAALDELGEWFT